MRAARLARVLPILAGVFVCVAAAAQEGDRQGELLELRDAIRESRERVTGHEREERDLLERLEEIDRSIQVSGRRVEGARAEAKAALAELRRIEGEREAIVTRLAATREAMSARAVALYKAGEVGPVRVLFASTSLRELFARISTLQRLLAHDARLVARYAEDRDALLRAEAAAKEASREREAAVARLRQRSAELAAERGSRRDLLARVRRDRSEERALLIELEKAARALEETLTRLGSGPERVAVLEGAGFEAQKGSLEPPVDAALVHGFGRVIDSEFQTETFRKGVEFGAEAGDLVRSVALGQVRYAGWFRGYGKIAIVDHGSDYFTVSGHLSEISVEVGDRVAPGDLLGTVGETGSLSGPGLYFEIRRGGEPLDPSDWLAPEE